MTPDVADLISWAIWTLIVAACLFAWWKGGAAERSGGSLNVFTCVCAGFAHLLPVGPRDTALLVADGVLAFGLLLLAVRYASLWIGAAMLLQAVQFVLHAYYFVVELRHDRLYAIVNNMVTLGIVGCIIAGTLLSWRRRAMTPAIA